MRGNTILYHKNIKFHVPIYERKKERKVRLII